ncbi:MAG: hypothetical protein DSY80_09795 [Desulfocapsa sp.]|nr:MAG: hypothetical protein DSY80_09795 [Desulfocapsa sp.]
MNSNVDTLNQSVGLVRCLLQNCYVKDAAVVDVQPIGPFKSSYCRLDAKGSTRVELLLDAVSIAKKAKTINLHGLAENCEEEKVPLFFYCETIWNDDITAENSFQQATNSFVLAAAENPSVFYDTEFNVFFEDPQNGEVAGRGEGYLRFEKERY